MPGISIAQNERRTARRASVPLVLVAASFFLPTYRACAHSNALQSPAEFVDDVPSALLFLPVYLCAGALALLTMRALLQRKLDLQTRRLGLAFVLLLVVTNGATFYELRGSREWMAMALVSSILTVVAIRSARGDTPWRIWDRLLLAYGIGAFGSFPTLFLSGELFRGSRDDLGIGAYLLPVSLAALLLVTGSAAARGRSTPAS